MKQQTEDAKVISITTMESQLDVVKKDFSSLFENSDFKKHMASMKRKYSVLKIETAEDKSVYEDIKKAISVVRPLRTELDKKVKAAKVDAKKYIKDVDELATMFQDEIAKVEDPLWVEREKYETLLKEADAKNKLEAEQKLESRIKDLIGNGVVFDGSYYSIGIISLGVQGIAELNDEKFDELMVSVKAANTEIIAAKLKKEAEEAEEKRKQDELKAENERKEKELADKQRELEAVKAKMEADLKEMEAQKTKMLHDKRAMELAPYIQFIRDYNAMINLPQDEYELQLSQVKEAANLHYENEKQKEIEKQALLEKQEKEKAILFEKSRKYESLGYAYNFQNETWSIKIGDEYQNTISRQQMLEGTDESFSAESHKVTSAKTLLFTKQELEAEKKRVADELAKKAAEDARLAKLNDEQVFNEWTSKLRAIEAPSVKDAGVLAKVNSILELIK